MQRKAHFKQEQAAAHGRRIDSGSDASPCNIFLGLNNFQHHFEVYLIYVIMYNP